jgi:putative hydrolase of the HAD superfamily
MIRAIAFDWGGVFTEGTFDSSASAALADACGLPLDAVQEPYLTLMAAFEEGAFEMAGFHRRFGEATGCDLDEEAFRATFLGAVRERTAMYAVLGAIPPEYTVGILSNNVPELCDLVRDDPRMQRVERFVFSNEIGVRKPDPRAYAALAEALDAAPHETLFVDDAERNVRAARALGFHVIHLTDMTAFLAGWNALLPDVPTDIDVQE